MSKMGQELEKKLDGNKYELLEAVKVALWDAEHDEGEAQKQGHPRLIERLEIYRQVIAKIESEQELCGECGRIATHIVNDCAYVCDDHAKGASLEGFLVKKIEG